MEMTGVWTIGLVVTGSLLALAVLTGLVYLLWRRRYPEVLQYDDIPGKVVFQKPPGAIPGDKITTTAIGQNQPCISSTQTIPFKLPPLQTPPGSRRSDSRVGLLDETTSPSSFQFQVSRSASDSSSISLASAKRSSLELSGHYALGTLDPSMYKMSEEDDMYEIPPKHIGRLWFAVEYERESEKLLVTLIKARNLPSRSMSANNACDPFVRLCLIPDERRYLQSKSKRKSCNPRFEESFVFQLSHKSFAERCLKLTVFDVDRHRRHVIIGHAVYPLQGHDTDDRVVIWRDLEREVTETCHSGGEVEVSLMYNDNLERLTVAVFDGKDFHIPEGNTTIDTYIKVNLSVQNKVVKSKKTDVVKKTVNPEFNESFTFRLPVSKLDTASVSITAMQQCAPGFKHRHIGRVVLGGYMFARGKELNHWNEMISSMRSQVSHWHTLT